jgi:hypothetical protein
MEFWYPRSATVSPGSGSRSRGMFCSSWQEPSTLSVILEAWYWTPCRHPFESASAANRCGKRVLNVALGPFDSETRSVRRCSDA